MGYTTWLLPQCFANADVAAGLKSLLTSHYTGTSYRSIYNSSGFSTVPTLVYAQISRNYLSGSASSMIGSANGCSGHSGR